MPIYEYRCDACAHEMETLQKMSDAPLKTCPECGEDKLIKKISAAAFRLKGGGWYETDFKSGNKRNLASSDTGSDGKGSADGKKDSSAGKTETGKTGGGTTAPAKKSET